MFSTAKLFVAAVGVSSLHTAECTATTTTTITTTTTTTADPDPWNAVTYSVESNGTIALPSPDNVSISGITFDTGCASTDVNGRAVVVHAPDSTRVGCGVLGYDAWSTTVTTDQNGDVSNQAFNVSGYVVGTSTSLLNADKTAYNAHGRTVVLHAADSTRIACGCCVEDGVPVVMERYDGYTGAINVSGNVTVSTQSTAPAMITLVSTLEGAEANATLGLHIHAGTSCDVGANVGPHFYDAGVALIGMYPDYPGPIEFSGTAQVSATSGGGISFSGFLLDNNDVTLAGQTGGIHIHTGMTCAVAADVGGHFYDPAECTTTTTTITTTTTAVDETTTRRDAELSDAAMTTAAYSAMIGAVLLSFTLE